MKDRQNQNDELPLQGSIPDDAYGFTLLEILTSMAILALLMGFMFSMVGQAFKVWDSGSRRMEASQAARIGLEQMAMDLQSALNGPQTASLLLPNTNTNQIHAYPPFWGMSNFAAKTLPGETGTVMQNSSSSGMLFAVAPIADPLATNGPFAAIGYMSAFVNNSTGYHMLSAQSYYLLRHSPINTSNNSPIAMPTNNNFYYRQAVSGSTPVASSPAPWTAYGINTGNRLSLVDNCYRMEVLFASNTANGLEFSGKWNSQTNLPAGVLITLSVMDAKTAAKIRVMGNGLLKPADIDPAATSDVARVLRAGTVKVQRFIPFLNSTN